MGSQPSRRTSALRFAAVGCLLVGVYLGLRYLAQKRVAGKRARQSADGASPPPRPGDGRPDAQRSGQPAGAPATHRSPATGSRSPEATEHAMVAARQQAVIDQVGHDLSGQPVDVVMAALRRGFVADGLALPTRLWLEAVAGEIASGHRFEVGEASGPPPVSGGDQPVRGEHELWFRPDPKIDYVPPGTRMSFRTDDPNANTPTPPEP